MNNDLTIIDLISEKHIVLRRAVRERWSEQEEEISQTEGFLMVRIRMGKISLAEIARQGNVSRQAIFKCAKKLEERGYLLFTENESGNKHTVLTDKGRDYCRRSDALKKQLESEIAEILGAEQVEALKSLLNRDWIT